MSKNNKKQMVVVLGMHRSGTSALTGVMTLLGAPMPQTPMVAHEINSKGFFESLAVMDLNNEILAAGRQRWRDWFPLDLQTRAIDALKPRIGEVIAQEFGGADFVVVKDPRMCRLMPLWLPAIRDQGYDPLIVLPYRHPLEVAESLRARYNIPLCDGLLLWLRYVLDAEWETRHLPRVFSAMPELLEDWRACIDRIGVATGANWPISPDQAAKDIDAFLDKDMKHQNLSSDLFETMPMMRGWISVTYAAMNGMSQADTAAWRARLDEVREAFDDAGNLFTPSIKEKQGGIVKLQTRINELEALPAADTQSAEIIRLTESLAATKAAFDKEKAQLVAERDDFARLLSETRRSYQELSEARKEILDISQAEATTLKAALRTKENEVAGLVPELAHFREMAEQATEAGLILRRQLQGELTRVESDSENDRAKLSKQLAKAKERSRLAEETANQANQKLASLEADLQSIKSRCQDTERRLNTYRRAGRVRLIRWAANPASRP